MPTFSIVIPTYNRADFLPRCLASLVAQTFHDFEVLVCDDGSTDNTKDIVNSFSERLNIRYFWNPNWGGPARPRNIGIQNAESSWICLLDSDDWFYPNKLQACSPYLETSDIIYHDLDIYNQNGKQSQTLKSQNLKHPVFIDLISTQNRLPNSSVVVRKEILLKIGGFSEDRALIAVEDFDAWLRISKITERFTCIQQSLGAYWLIGESHNISANKKNLLSEYALFDYHKQDIASELLDKSIQSSRFFLARRLHQFGNFKVASQCYRESIIGPNLIISIKSILLIIFCNMHIRK